MVRLFWEGAREGGRMEESAFLECQEEIQLTPTSLRIRTILPTKILHPPIPGIIADLLAIHSAQAITTSPRSDSFQMFESVSSKKM